jgi:carbonic anhydrase/acetyltransferase-like protein (isoleucine patch superfamily)
MKFIHDEAIILGNVEVGEDTSIWPGAVIRGDFGLIKIGKNCSIQDNAVIHSDSDKTLEIGNNVIIAHTAVLHSCKIGDNVLVGIGSIILDDCKIGDNVLIAAGTLLKPRTEIPSDSFVYQKEGKLTIKKIKQRHLDLIERILRFNSELARKYLEGVVK